MLIIYAELNSFEYCKNEPIMYIDPMGTASISSTNSKTSVSVCINTPSWNSTVVFAKSGNAYTAGHVFLKLYPGKDTYLKQKYGACSFGFAPKSSNTLVVTAAQVACAYLYVSGKIKSEANSKFHTSVTFNISRSQFIAIYNYCHPRKTPSYNIVKFNCATFALAALERAKDNHRFRKGFWNFGAFGFLMSVAYAFNGLSRFYFYGYTPAQMAYDVMRGKY